MMHPKDDFITYMSAVTARLQSLERLGTAHVYRSTLNRIKDFVGGRPLPFSDITPLWLQAFQNYLLKRQLNWNTISTYMRMLRAVYYRAIDEGCAPFRPRLFKGVYTGTRVTVKRALDEQILRRIKKASCVSQPTGRHPSALHAALHAAWYSLCRYCLHAPLRSERRHTDLPPS